MSGPLGEFLNWGCSRANSTNRKHTYTAYTSCIVMVRVTAADICPMWIQRGRDSACVAKRGHKNHVSRMEGRVMTDFRDFCEGIWTYTDIRDTHRGGLEKLFGLETDALHQGRSTSRS